MKALVVAIAVCAVAVVAYLILAGQGPLTASQMAEALTGNTVRGLSADKRVDFVYYAPQGQNWMRTTDGFIDRGQWRVTPDDLYCGRWDRVRDGSEKCFTIYREGSMLRFEDGDTVLELELIQGNPENLGGQQGGRSRGTQELG